MEQFFSSFSSSPRRRDLSSRSPNLGFRSGSSQGDGGEGGGGAGVGAEEEEERGGMGAGEEAGAGWQEEEG